MVVLYGFGSSSCVAERFFYVNDMEHSAFRLSDGAFTKCAKY